MKFKFSDLWHQWVYGILEGLIIGVLIAIIAFPSLFWIILAMISFNTVTSLLLIRQSNLFSFGSFSKPGNSNRKQWEKEHPACSECGSRTRHKKSCSKAKT